MSIVDFTTVYDAETVHIAYDRLVKVINETCKYVLVRQQTRKVAKKPWITAGILKCNNKKNKRYSKHCREPFNTQVKHKYNQYRSVLKQVMKMLEKITIAIVLLKRVVIQST